MSKSDIIYGVLTKRLQNIMSNAFREDVTLELVSWNDIQKESREFEMFLNVGGFEDIVLRVSAPLSRYDSMSIDEIIESVVNKFKEMGEEVRGWMDKRVYITEVKAEI